MSNGVWLPNVDLSKIAPVDGGMYVNAPPRGVLHTTESADIGPAISTFQATNFWPHLTIDSRTKQVMQHISLDRAARGLEVSAGHVETNRAQCVQIEIVGFADVTKAPGGSWPWTSDMLDFIASIMRHVELLAGVPRASGLTFEAYPASYGPSNGVRLSETDWMAFSGWCGHEHVPENVHGDPGDMDIVYLLTTALPKVTSVTPARGTATGGTTVTVSGGGLLSAAGVTFNGTAATFTFVNDSSLTATSPPPQGSGLITVDVLVATQIGNSSANPADQFTYIPPPTATSSIPDNGPSAGNTEVTITGTGLTDVFSVGFGDTGASSIAVVSDSELSAITPPGSGTVDVTVTNPSGSATSPNQYTYT
jgi:IPT/TIG domain